MAADPEPRPLPGPAGRLLAGNPFQDERVAFRWLITVLAAAVTVVAVAKLVSTAAAVVWGILLLLVFGFGILRVFIWLIGSPDEDEPDGRDSPDDPDDPDDPDAAEGRSASRGDRREGRPT